ncbi:carbohydrate ABC transporter permease [Sphaerisporangium fuscum]|uniref:carbohydrate ABC transporter permease n=1 Tax=Sphaerisporangium fuscum TaxID=2835868 RepID=UPI001BDD5366|nr:carbohydrate ABC transporter permease [Sphaerisporangium fuscum]
MRAGRALAWTVMAVAVVVTVFPFYWMVRTAFTDANHLFSDNFSLIPRHFTLANFKRVLGLSTIAEAQAAGGSGAALDFLLYLRNSVVYTGLIVVVQTLCCALAGYALARLRFRGRELVFSLFVSALMIPPIFTLLPNFAMVRGLGLLNTFAGLVAPSLLMTPFTVFFLRQFFLSLPREVEEAAFIDGAGLWTIFWRVALPMSKGPLITIAITNAVWAWKDYLWPLLVGQEEGDRVLTVALGVFLQQSPNSRPDWTGLMAGSALSVLPVLLLLLVFGKRLANSLQFTGIK